jgi:hypothetical protein
VHSLSKGFEMIDRLKDDWDEIPPLRKGILVTFAAVAVCAAIALFTGIWEPFAVEVG